MNGELDLSLVTDRVDVGDAVRVAVVVPEGLAVDNWRVVLQCHVHSASPAQVAVASAPLTAPPSPNRLTVPDTGPVTHHGASFEVSWSVAVVDDTGSPRAEKPVIITPRGGVALWLQRHAPPPA